VQNSEKQISNMPDANVGGFVRSRLSQSFVYATGGISPNARDPARAAIKSNGDARVPQKMLDQSLMHAAF
jgi:hypothetical protein